MGAAVNIRSLPYLPYLPPFNVHIVVHLRARPAPLALLALMLRIKELRRKRAHTDNTHAPEMIRVYTFEKGEGSG